MKISLLINYEWWDSADPKRHLDGKVMEALNAHADCVITEALDTGVREGQLLCVVDDVAYQGYFKIVRTEATQ